MPESDRQYDREWHLDKKVPLAQITALAVQTCVIVWWAATMSARVDQLEQKAASSAPQAERVIRLDAKVDELIGRIAEIKGLVSSPRDTVRR